MLDHYPFIASSSRKTMTFFTHRESPGMIAVKTILTVLGIPKLLECPAVQTFLENG